MTSCTRKGRYPTEGLAASIARRQSARTGEIIKAYACSDCGAFHIGHLSLRVPREVRARGRRR